MALDLGCPIGAFVEYERAAVKILLGAHMSAERVRDLLDSAEPISCEHTGVGYFLTVQHPTLRTGRAVYEDPLVTGTAEDISCGFVVFLEDRQLTLECHSWGDSPIPTDIRERRIEVAAGDRP